jgi:hypothetical protein
MTMSSRSCTSGASRGRLAAWTVAVVLGLALAGFGQIPLAWGTPFTGNSLLTDGNTINFSVFSASDPAIAAIAPSFVPGALSPGLSSGGFIYLYQPVNDGPIASNSILSFSQKLGDPGNNPPISPSSWGYFSHTVFCTNSPICGAVVGPGTPLPNNATPSFVTNAVAINPLAPPGLGVSGLTALYAGFTDPNTGSILAFTSPFGPQFDATGASYFGTLAFGIGTDPDPSAVPEASSLLLSAIALGTAFAPFAQGRLRWRRRATHAS